MVTVILPNKKGVQAKRELLMLAAKLKNKYNIHFNRDAYDEYEALYGILAGLEQILREKERSSEEANKVKAFIDAIISEKGEITAEGVYVWPRHMKEEAEELGIDWEAFKEELKKSGLLEFDQRKRKYRVKM